MNGLQITGMKISSPAPTKKIAPTIGKATKTNSMKPEISRQKKPSIPTVNKSSTTSKKTSEKPKPKRKE